jgi:protein tyrosine phosphatase (PTP) superfamily phosphohydrolase (DUF442 family)
MLYFLFQDHAIFRALWSNTHRVARLVWRSNHPTYRRLRRLKQLGVENVLSLRGNTKKSPYLFEKESCDRLGLTLTVIALGARNVWRKERVIALLDYFDNTDAPFLMHCKSGADRTSLAAAYYLIYKCGTPVALARKQLGMRYLHFKWTKTGVLDFMLDEYEHFSNQNPDRDLRYWITNVYDADAIKQAFNQERAAKGKSQIK